MLYDVIKAVKECLGILKLALAVIAGVGAVLVAAPSHSITHEFYRDKRLTLIDGGGPGGGTDTLARTVARVLDKHLGTKITIVQNMPGAGGVVMTNYVSSVAKPDGLTLGIHIGASLALRQITLPGSVYDLGGLSWVGVLQPLQNVLVADKRKYRSVEDLRSRKKPISSRKKPISYGLVAKGGMAQFAGITVGKLLGLDFNFIPGYGGGELAAAMERGEIDVTAGSVLPFLDGIKAGRFVPLMVMSRFRDPAAPEAPTVQEALGKIPSPLDTWVDLSLVGRFFFGPPGIPPDRLAFLRQAFLAVSKDPRFSELAQKQRLLIRFIPGEEAKKITNNFLAMSEEQQRELKKLLE